MKLPKTLPCAVSAHLGEWGVISLRPIIASTTFDDYLGHGGINETDWRGCAIIDCTDS
ncbi:MAG: hypothetical protein NZ936_10135 [Alphaproteobacteria bacterium]|nr:hypothetical protein [Alphaproteobacteria bacterium]